jgi:hypothetical protein
LLRLLCGEFGLPEGEARRYAAVLFPGAAVDPLLTKLVKILSNFGGRDGN